MDANRRCLEHRKKRLGMGIRTLGLSARTTKMFLSKNVQHFPAEGSNLKRTCPVTNNVLGGIENSFGKKIARRTGTAKVDQADHENDDQENNFGELDGPNLGNDADDNHPPDADENIPPVDIQLYAGEGIKDVSSVLVGRNT
jgi:hypothetical protein